MDAIHVWSQCHHCGAQPVVGRLHRCVTCPIGPHTDLCSSCHALWTDELISHPPEDVYFSAAGKHEFVALEGSRADACERWIRVPTQGQVPPAVRLSFLVRPEFVAAHATSFGGYGFLVETARGPLLLTALHVMDELIKSMPAGAAFSAAGVAQLVSGVNLYDVLADNWMQHLVGTAGPMLPLAEARLGSDLVCAAGDICAFLVQPGRHLCTAPLAHSLPAVGEQVWLAAKHSSQRHLRLATVVEADATCLIYRFEDPDGAKYSSGAPMLNGTGAVVGINLAEGGYQQYKLGYANPVIAIRNHLRSFSPID